MTPFPPENKHSNANTTQLRYQITYTFFKSLNISTIDIHKEVM